MQTHVRLNPSERPGAGCIVLPPADPRGVVDHGLPGVARDINHRSRRLALANLSSASEALNLSTGQRTACSEATRTRFFVCLHFERRLKSERVKKRQMLLRNFIPRSP